MLRRFTSFTYAFLISFSNSWAASDIAYEEIEYFFQQHSISKTYGPQSFLNLTNYLTNSLDSMPIDKEKPRAFYQFGLEWLKDIESKSEREKIETYINIKRLIYSVKADEVKNEAGWIESIFNTIARIDSSSPYVYPSDRSSILPRELAQKEAKNLILTNKDSEFLNSYDFESMNHLQISELDISSDHTFWRQQHDIKKKRNTWREIEMFFENNYTKKFDQRYDLDKARRILFIDRIKSSGTSPKINTRDSFNVKWKLKWGAETQSEPIANRLYLKAGAKFADLVYANRAGSEELVLILEKQWKDGQKIQGNCDYINTIRLFKDCLMNSNYEFDVDPFILDSGQLSHDNIETILKNLPRFPIDDDLEIDSLLRDGRFFITFKTSSVEFKGEEGMTRGGPASLNLVHAQDDRVLRSLFLFNQWIKNIDAKDENSKASLINGLYSDSPDFIEYIHDMGASFGKLARVLDLNSLEKDFLKPWFGRLHYDDFLLYRPKSWDMMTFADGRWMANNIAKITPEEIKEIVSHTRWPKPYQEVLVYKLIERRNHLAKQYGVSINGTKQISFKAIVVELSTKQDRDKAYETYLLPFGIPKSRLLEGLKLKNKNEVIDYRDIIADENAMLSSCKDSLISNLLEAMFPSGLTRRLMRSRDFKPLKKCNFSRHRSFFDWW